MVENRLTVAKNLGATHTIQVNANASSEDLAVEVEKSLGAKPDIAIDACGAESTIALNMLVSEFLIDNFNYRLSKTAR